MYKSISDFFTNFANETSHWQFINSYFKPAVTRFFISWFALAPAAVKFIDGLPSPLNVSIGQNTYSIALELPFSWAVLWWASLIYAIAFVIHSLICPGFIRRYPKYADYLERGHSPRWLVWEVYRAWQSISKKARLKLFRRLTEKNYSCESETEAQCYTTPSVTGAGTEWVFEYKNHKRLLRIDETMSAERQKDLFWEVLARHAASRSWARYTIWILLAVTAILVSLVVVQNIVFVLRFLTS
ncbi:hypothetical protein [Nitratireductor sp. XY-223]|uniref:hypothetical protein n=1 Tax=Nitratireductor sp. XY-223 TaxID=2561926 RepID=UPI0010AA5011|nr:hypothetical protein [Nitratireductor sp. XY-223]